MSVGPCHWAAAAHREIRSPIGSRAGASSDPPLTRKMRPVPGGRMPNPTNGPARVSVRVPIW